MNSDCDWDKVRNFFRQFNPGEFLVRGMYMDVMRASGIQESTLDTYRCYLQRAGYIYDKEYYFRNRGVYFISRPIPPTLTLYQVEREAYDKKFIPNYPHSKFIVELEASPEFSNLVGMRYGTRSEFLVRLWVYIKENELLSKLERRTILAGKDAAFKKLMGGCESMSMFEMPYYINKNLKKRSKK